MEARATRQGWTIRTKNAKGLEIYEQFARSTEQEEDARQPLRGKTVDFSKMRVTSLQFNKFVSMPKPADEREELGIQSERLDSLKWKKIVMKEAKWKDLTT